MDGQGIKTALGKNIKQLRAKRQYSQADLAEKAGISITFLSNIERGLKFPKPENLAQIAKGLGVEVCELFRINLSETLSQSASRIKKDDKKIMLHRLSKVMTRKINNTMEAVFNTFIK